MYAFTEHYADKAGDNSPLKLLYVQLYASLLDSAWVACNSNEGEDLKKCVASVMDKSVKPHLADQVYIALDLYNKTDPHQFTLALKPILSDMVITSGGEHYAGNILQLAASRVGSQNQLVNNNAGHNNYMLDEITAKTWYHNGHYENAEKKYKEALSDIEHAPFPDEEEKDIAISGIYDELSGVYSKTSQFVNVIAYQNAAIAMGGNAFNDYRPLKCHSYYSLKLYAEAVQECTGRFDDGADIQTRFWRGKSYKALGQGDAALQDFSVIANSEDRNYRTSAAIEISVIYGERNDMVNMLASLNKHQYLFDVEDQNKDILAVSYNNRCYAHMQLGQLQKALNDCTASLKYGSLPDAYQKQQELIKKLTPTR
jgi:tetratricopeptide (TPR) repeat protein